MKKRSKREPTNRHSFEEVYVHNVGRSQEEFIRAYGERVIPRLGWPER